MRRQYFWHRFFGHQPDLNFENPRVVDAMLDVGRFWLGIGVDGFRLDAVPYLFEAEGTNCENLPETHAFLRKVRRMIDDEFPGRIMLAGGEPVATRTWSCTTSAPRPSPSATCASTSR